MRTPALRLALFPLLASLAACGDASARPGEAAVRDSAGVRIVESTEPAWGEGEGWRLSAEPLLDVGVADGDPAYQFGRVVGALRLPDGTLVVADRQSRELRFFDRDGRHVRTAGGKGGGPGELQSMHRLLRARGDSVAVWDDQSSRLSLFSPRGDFVRSTTVEPERESLVLQAEGVFADGSLLVTPLFNWVFRPGTEEARDTAVYVRYSAEGAALDTLGRFPGTQTITVTGRENGGWALRGNVPFGLNTFRAVHGDRLYVADNERYQVAVYDRAGALVQVVRAARQPQPLTPAEIESYKRDQLAMVGKGEDRLM
ncbi:MAG TPA: hypothetical protein VF263_02055, partial [Longimicrobiaceae bacterium]